jgi:hypothetical protein
VLNLSSRFQTQHVRSSAERLVGSESDKRQSQRIHSEFVILHILAEDIGDAGGPSLALDLGMIGGIREHLFEFDSRRIRRLTEIVENDILDLDIDVRKRAVFDIGLNDVVVALTRRSCSSSDI